LPLSANRNGKLVGHLCQAQFAVAGPGGLQVSDPREPQRRQADEESDNYAYRAAIQVLMAKHLHKRPGPRQQEQRQGHRAVSPRRMADRD
jgi:hypothetical protein